MSGGEEGWGGGVVKKSLHFKLPVQQFSYTSKHWPLTNIMDENDGRYYCFADTSRDTARNS